MSTKKDPITIEYITVGLQPQELDQRFFGNLSQYERFQKYIKNNNLTVTTFIDSVYRYFDWQTQKERMYWYETLIASKHAQWGQISHFHTVNVPEELVKEGKKPGPETEWNEKNIARLQKCFRIKPNLYFKTEDGHVLGLTMQKFLNFTHEQIIEADRPAHIDQNSLAAALAKAVEGVTKK